MDAKFTRVEWASGANIYEVNLRQYTPEGTFSAFEKEMPRLRDMGVEILWFMPITPISKEKRLGTLGSYYACSDYLQTNPEFGTIADFKHLVSYAHSLGFKVIIDWVANHTGWDHVWTKTNPEFYKKDHNGNFYDPNGWDDVIDLDYTNPEMREALTRAMEFWVSETAIDGYRCDMAHLVPLDFWRNVRTRLDQQKPLFWLAETQEIQFHEVFDVTYAWEFLHAMEAYWKKQADLHTLEAVLDRYASERSKDAIQLFFTSNHDENSHSGSEYERLGDSVKAFAVLCATWQNAMPLIYSGQELPNKKRLAFFEKDPIKWTGNVLLHDFYKSLLILHRSHPALQAGDPAVRVTRLSTSNQSIFAFKREKGDRQVLVLLNLSSTGKLRFTIFDDTLTGKYTSAFSGMDYEFENGNSFEIQAWEYLVYTR